jgi:hypothetical protein
MQQKPLNQGKILFGLKIKCLLSYIIFPFITFEIIFQYL